mgnify:FL=1
MPADDLNSIPPRIIVGCWQLAAGHTPDREVDRSSQLEALAAYFKAGFTTFDCADIYTGVEDTLGDLRDLLRERWPDQVDQLRIHTKFVPDRPVLPAIDRNYVESIIDRSLARLRTDRLDLVQFHWWDFAVPGCVEVAQILNGLRTAGKISNFGLTNFDTRRTAEIVDAGVPVFSNQVQWSLLDQRPAAEFARFAEEHNTKVFCYGGLAGGFLTDRYLGADAPVEPLSNRSLTKYKLIIDEAGGWDAFQSLLRALRDVADQHKCSIAETALAWVLQQPGVSAVIAGARVCASAEAQEAVLASLKRAQEIKLSEADLSNIAGGLAGLKAISGAIYEREREKTSAHAKIMRYNLNSQPRG